MTSIRPSQDGFFCYDNSMRKQYFVWTIAVFGIIGTAYGASSLIYHFNKGKGLFIPALVLLICGGLALMLFLSLYIASLVSQKKKKEELPVIDVEPEPVEEEKKPEPTYKPEQKDEIEYVSRSERSYFSSSIYDVSTIYVKQVGQGPVLRVEGNRILDMRTNTYYRIEGNMVNQEGYGPVFEIRGNQIRSTFGGYLYELSGSNINRTYGGFYASISGNYITLFDASVKYELTDRLSKNQTLVVAALLFGRY